MADAFLTLLDITKQNGTDQAVGIVEEVRTFAPEVEVIGGRPIRGTTYKALVRTTLPLGPAFRAANQGSSVVASTWDQRINQTFYFDGQMRVDEMVLDASEFGAEWTLANEALGVAKTKLISLGYQVYYGQPGVVSKTAPAGGNSNYGFPGLVGLYDPAAMEIMGGATTGSTLSSAWLIVNAPDCVEFIYGNNQGLQLKQWMPQYVLDASSKQYRAFLNNLSGFVGLSFNYTKSACRIKNLDTGSNGLTDAAVASALALFPVGTVPTHLFCNRNQRLALQKSRTPVYASGVSGLTAATALQYPHIPTESNGIPLYVTDSITQTENYGAAGSATF
jgi:major capsid protein gp7